MDTSKVAWHSDIRTAGIDRFCAVACWKGEKSVSVMVDKNEAMSMRNTLNVREEERSSSALLLPDPNSPRSSK